MRLFDDVWQHNSLSKLWRLIWECLHGQALTSSRYASFQDALFAYAETQPGDQPFQKTLIDFFRQSKVKDVIPELARCRDVAIVQSSTPSGVLSTAAALGLIADPPPRAYLVKPLPVFRPVPLPAAMRSGAVSDAAYGNWLRVLWPDCPDATVQGLWELAAVAKPPELFNVAVDLESGRLVTLF